MRRRTGEVRVSIDATPGRRRTMRPGGVAPSRRRPILEAAVTARGRRLGDHAGAALVGDSRPRPSRASRSAGSGSRSGSRCARTARTARPGSRRSAARRSRARRGRPPPPCARSSPGCRSRCSGTAASARRAGGAAGSCRGRAAHLLGGGADAGHRLAARPGRGCVPRRGRRPPQISGWPGRLRSGSTTTRPARSSVAPVAAGERAAERRCRRRRRPRSRCGWRAVACGRVAVAASRRSRRRHRCRSPCSRCARRRRGARAARGLLRQLRARTRRGRGRQPSSRMTRVCRESMRRNSPRQRVLRDLAQRAGHLDAGRPAADHDEGQPRLARRRVGAALGVLERRR